MEHPTYDRQSHGLLRNGRARKWFAPVASVPVLLFCYTCLQRPENPAFPGGSPRTGRCRQHCRMKGQPAASSAAKSNVELNIKSGIK